MMAALRERQAELQAEVFASPPKTYEEFSVRLGQWTENQAQQQALREMIETRHTEDI